MATKLSFNDVLTRCDNSFNNLFNIDLLSEMVDKGIVTERAKQRVDAVKRKARKVPMLLAYMKAMDPPLFSKFLHLLEMNSFYEEDRTTREKTQNLMVIMRPDVKNMRRYGGEREEEIIQSFLDTAGSYISRKGKGQVFSTEQQMPLETSIGRLNLPSHAPPIPPKDGFAETQLFERCGGTMYSPTHGIEVAIPQDALPEQITRFVLSFYIYLQGPFYLPKDVIPIAPTVWFSLTPHFEFIKDVTIRIPHSAHVSDDLDIDVYRLPSSECKGAPYILSERVTVCDCDCYYTVMKVKHFSPYRPGAKRGCKKTKKVASCTSKHSTRKQIPENLKSFTKQKSSSFKKECMLDELTTKKQITPDTHDVATPPMDSEVQGCCSVNKYLMSREMPVNREIQWEERFHVVHSHPSHIWEMIVKAVSTRENRLLSPLPFQFMERSLQFFRREISDRWSVDPVNGEVIICDDMEWRPVPIGSTLKREIEIGSYPSTIVYQVSSNQSPPHPLKCKIEITGANRSLEYTLTSSSPTKKGPSSLSLHTSADLYDPDSRLVQELATGDWKMVHLNKTNPEHLTLITDISLQLPDPDKSFELLKDHVDNAEYEKILCNYSNCCSEQVFQLLYGCVCAHHVPLTLQELCTTLKVREIILEKEGAIDGGIKTHQIAAKLEERRVSLSDKVCIDLATFLQASWQFVARFLGVPEERISTLKLENPHSCTNQSFEMLKEWHKRQGNRATYGRLFMAIERLLRSPLTAANVNNAFTYLINNA